MGLLDSVVGMLGQGQQGGAGGAGNAALISAVIGMLANSGAAGNNAGGALGGLGGLAGLVTQLQRSGLGDVVASWISTGQNLPVSPGQLHSALGDETVGALSQQTGLPQGDLLSQLSELLPQMVDHATPNGQLPAAGDDNGLGDLSGLLGAFLKR